MAPLQRKPESNTPRGEPAPADQPEPRPIERFIKTTFEKLPPRTKVLIALFAALNNAATLTKGFDLPDRLWQTIGFETCGPLSGESEEANWLKGVCDGLRLMSQYS